MSATIKQKRQTCYANAAWNALLLSDAASCAMNISIIEMLKSMTDKDKISLQTALNDHFSAFNTQRVQGGKYDTISMIQVWIFMTKSFALKNYPPGRTQNAKNNNTCYLVDGYKDFDYADISFIDIWRKMNLSKRADIMLVDAVMTDRMYVHQFEDFMRAILKKGSNEIEGIANTNTKTIAKANVHIKSFHLQTAIIHILCRSIFGDVANNVSHFAVVYPSKENVAQYVVNDSSQVKNMPFDEYVTMYTETQIQHPTITKFDIKWANNLRKTKMTMSNAQNMLIKYICDLRNEFTLEMGIELYKSRNPKEDTKLIDFTVQVEYRIYGSSSTNGYLTHGNTKTRHDEEISHHIRYMRRSNQVAMSNSNVNDPAKRSGTHQAKSGERKRNIRQEKEKEKENKVLQNK
jgi:hypothetical protein